MSKFASLVLAAALSIATLGITTRPGEAGRGGYGFYGDGSDFGGMFGDLYPEQPFYPPYYKPDVPGQSFSFTPSYGVTDGHAASCASRYRSYRASDNTFQPYKGPRRQCR